MQTRNQGPRPYDPYDPHGTHTFWRNVGTISIYTGMASLAVGWAILGIFANIWDHGTPGHGITAETYKKKK
ncbi:hypothetical protein H7X87_01805 [Acetobacteraceae bacterium]|nr:hypothetical protein [Candidatus Parcubacteria bacterium]